MSVLILSFAREILGRWGLPLFAAGLYCATQLSFNTALGAATIGTYLAYVSLWPIALLFRCGWLLQQRRTEGWPLEEILRDPHGFRAPLSEFAACGLLCILGLAAALLPLKISDSSLPQDSSGLYPVRMVPSSVDAAASTPATWTFELHSPVPSASTLLLTLDWSATSGEVTEAILSNNAGDTRTATAGQILRWPLSAAEAQTGKVALEAPQDLPLRVFRPLVRLEIPRPGMKQLPLLLLQQLLFFLPLFAVLLALARFGRSNAKLATWAVFFFGSLAAYHPPTHLHQVDLPWFASSILALKQVLPNVDGLLATGYRFERSVGTTTSGATLAWLALGFLALLLACKRRKP